MKAVKVERSEAIGIEPVMWRITCLRSIFKVIKGEKLARQPNSVTALTSKVDEESFLEVLDIHAVEGGGSTLRASCGRPITAKSARPAWTGDTFLGVLR